MSNSEIVTRQRSSNLEPYISKLIEDSRENLIREAVRDPEVEAELLKINESIKNLKVKDPGVVAAWGLGCGGGC